MRALLLVSLIGVAGLTPERSVAAVTAPANRVQLAYMLETQNEKQIILTHADGSSPHAVTSGSNWHLYPDLNAAGTQLAYVEGTDAAHLAVKTMDLVSGKVETWSSADGMNIHPRFSGDGRFLAYSAPVGPGGMHQIVILDLVAEHTRHPRPADASVSDARVLATRPRIITSEFPCYFPALSSNGRYVAFHRTKGKDKDVVVLDLEKNALVQVGEPTGVSMSPRFSFDNRYVAYSRLENNNWDIYVTDWRKGTTVRATSHAGKEHAPAFLPDGSLMFASDRSGHFELYRIPVVGLDQGEGAVQPLVTGPGSHYAPSASGTTAAYLKQGLLAQIPAPARSSFGAVLHRGKVYVCGGHQGQEHTYPESSFLPNLEIFDPATGQWNRGASRPTPCHGYQVVGYDHYLYAFGGFAFSPDHKPKWKSLDVIDRYDIDADRWETVGHLPRPRSSNVVAVHGKLVYLIGGWDSTPQHAGDQEGRFHRTIDIYDLVTGAVSTAPYGIPDPLRRALSSVTVGDEVLLVGGLGQGATHFELLDKVTAFNPATGTFREWPKLPFATFAPAVGCLGKELVVVGGMFKTAPKQYEYVNHIFTLASPEASWTHTGRYLTESKGFAQVVEFTPNRLGILGGHSYHNGQADAPVPTFELLELLQNY